MALNQASRTGGWLGAALAFALAWALLAPREAAASGSWAVPRFTPTWAELERDLRTLGLKKRPIARAPTKPARAPAPTPKPTGEAAVAAGTGAGTGQVPATSPVTEAAQTAPQPCKCPEAPPPPCPAAAPPAPQTSPAAQTPPAPPEKPSATAKPAKAVKKKGKPKESDKKGDRKNYWWQEQ
ncbi:MAG: hypothetical protein HYZ28_03400 [Myxococcales bacterium]|nr:hypothetical protein [Myxococcales bacterium]